MREKTDPNAPAMPGEERVLQGGRPREDPLWITVKHSGLTKREWFAGLAMQGLCAGLVPAHQSGKVSFYAKGPCNARLAERSVALADALIRALSEEEASHGE